MVEIFNSENMRVICIDASNRCNSYYIDASTGLVENDIYNVIREAEAVDRNGVVFVSYELQEFIGKGFFKDRFIPLQDESPEYTNIEYGELIEEEAIKLFYGKEK